MMRLIWIARSALTNSMSGSAKPRSAKTLPLPSMISSSLMAVPPLTEDDMGGAFLCRPQSTTDKIHLPLRRLDPMCRLLLEGMENIDRVRERDRVDRSVGVAVIVFDDLSHAGTAEALERF